MSFCGSPFWDWNRTWNGSIPHFTPCFEETVLAWSPLIFLWLFAAVSVFCTRKDSHSQKTPWNYLNSAKACTTMVLTGIKMFVLSSELYSNFKQNETLYPVSVLTPVVQIVTFCLEVRLVILDKNHGSPSSGTLFFFWLLMSICEVFAFHTAITGFSSQMKSNELKLIAELVFYPFVLVAFALNFWADSPPTLCCEGQNPSPKKGSSVPSRLFFSWFGKMAWKGYRTPLEVKDLWDLDSEEKSRTHVPIFENIWQQTRRNQKNLVTRIESSGEQAQSTSHTNTLPVFLKMFWQDILLGGILELANVLFSFVAPQILKLLISYVQNTDGIHDGESWKGYFYVVILFASESIRIIAINHHYVKMDITGMRMMSTLANVIYRKSLLVSGSARKESSTGEIVNLQSVDSQRFEDNLWQAHYLWSMPLQVALCIYFLWEILGPSVLAGVGVMILLIPSNLYISSRMQKLEEKQMKLKDIRIKQMNEILAGIKVIKLYAWEKSLGSQVLNIRDNEIKVLKTNAYLDAITAFCWNCTPFLV